MSLHQPPLHGLLPLQPSHPKTQLHLTLQAPLEFKHHRISEYKMHNYFSRNANFARRVVMIGIPEPGKWWAHGRGVIHATFQARKAL